MKLTLETQISLVLGPALILLLFIEAISYVSIGQMKAAFAKETQTRIVLDYLEQTISAIVESESGTRGFAITGNEAYLNDFTEAGKRIDQQLAEIRRLASDNDAQQRRIAILVPEIAKKNEFNLKVIGVRRLQGFTPATDAIASHQGKVSMDEISRIIGEMKQEEIRLLELHKADVNQTIEKSFIVLLIGTILAILLLTYVGFAILREVRQRQKAEEERKIANVTMERRVIERTSELNQTNLELRKSEEFNRMIFESSPDCVSILELDGSIFSMNAPGMSLMEIDDFSNYKGKPWIEFWDEIDHKTINDMLEVARGGDKGNFQSFCRTAKGTPKWWDVSIAPILDTEGKPVRLILTSRDITERKQMEAERELLLTREQATRQQAEEANRLKDEFVATVSHELRAPLNAILGWARLLRGGKMDQSASDKAVETIERSADIQARLIEDLLDISRIVTGKLRLDVRAIDPTNVINAALETVSPAAEAKAITIESNLDPEMSLIMGDANRLQQVVWNLLSNAIKFTPRGGQIKISLTRDDSQITIRVSDNGQGISPEFLPHVFDRFRQGDSSSIRKHGGLGIGLSIVRHLVEMHGGTVGAESEGVNKGSCFVVTLPIMPLRRQETQLAGSLSTGEWKLSLTKLPRLDDLLILVVDDEEDARLLIAQMLTEYGATVIAAGSAAEAIDLLKQQEPDLMISDIGMPEEDGYSLIHKIRSMSTGKNGKIPAVALTSYAQTRDRMRAIAAGYQLHVPKPVEPEELAMVIASLTGRLSKNGPES